MIISFVYSLEQENGIANSRKPAGTLFVQQHIAGSIRLLRLKYRLFLGKSCVSGPELTVQDRSSIKIHIKWLFNAGDKALHGVQCSNRYDVAGSLAIEKNGTFQRDAHRLEVPFYVFSYAVQIISRQEEEICRILF